MAKGYKMGQSGGVNKTLPYQVTGLTATSDFVPSITVSWINPTEYWAGTLIVKKVGSAPTGVHDGEKVYDGTGTTFVDTDVEFDTDYYYRAFPYNEKGQYQTEYLAINHIPLNAISFADLPNGAKIKTTYAGKTEYLMKVKNSRLHPCIFINSSAAVTVSGNYSTMPNIINVTAASGKFSNQYPGLLADLTGMHFLENYVEDYFTTTAQWKRKTTAGAYAKYFVNHFGTYNSDVPSPYYATIIYRSTSGERIVEGGWTTASKTISLTAYYLFDLNVPSDKITMILVEPQPNADGSYNLIT